jgi:hypothetical protein
VVRPDRIDEGIGGDVKTAAFNAVIVALLVFAAEHITLALIQPTFETRHAADLYLMVSTGTLVLIISTIVVIARRFK